MPAVASASVNVYGRVTSVVKTSVTSVAPLCFVSVTVSSSAVKVAPTFLVVGPVTAKETTGSAAAAIVIVTGSEVIEPALATTVTVPSAFVTKVLPVNVTKSAPAVTSYSTASVVSAGVTVEVNVTVSPTVASSLSAVRVTAVAGTSIKASVEVPTNKSWFVVVSPLEL